MFIAKAQILNMSVIELAFKIKALLKKKLIINDIF